jgi:hypothetical protein
MKKVVLIFSFLFFNLNLYSQDYIYVGSKRVELFERINKYLAKYDFNGDGLDDLLVGGENLQTLNKTKILLLINKGDGTFVDSTSKYITGPVVANSPVSAVADFNNDGIMDLAIFDAGNGELGQDPILSGFYGETPMLLISQNGKRLWDVSDVLGKAVSKITNYPTNGEKLHVKHANIGDINNDGLVDIIVESGGGYRQPLNHFYINKGNGQFEADATRIDQSILVGPDFNWRYDNNYLVDLNNDGYMDLVMGNLRRKFNLQDDMHSIVIFNDKKGNFRTNKVVNLPRPNFNDSWGYARVIKPFDFNGDGFDDLTIMYVRSQDSSSKFAFTGTYFQVLINNQKGNFQDSTNKYIENNKWMTSETDSIFNIPNKNEPNDFEFTDVNNDGFKDLFMIRSWNMASKYMPIIMLNNGINIFQPIDSNKISNGNKYLGMLPINIDLNGDKSTDILFLDTRPGKDLVYGTADDVMESAPIFANFKPEISDTVFSIKEKQSKGFKIGKVNIVDKNDKKLDLKLSGTLSSSFQIDSSGNIFIFDSLTFVYEKRKFVEVVLEVTDKFITSKSTIRVNLICDIQKPQFSSTKYIVCSPDSTKIDFTNSTTSDTLVWFINGVKDSVKSSSKYIKDATKLYVFKTNQQGCSIYSDTIYIGKFIKPSSPTLSRDSANYLISNSIIGNTWFKDGTAIADTTQKIKPTTPGSYTAKTTQNGCVSSLSTPYYYLVTDIINLSKDEFIKLAPNPFVNQLNFDFLLKGYQKINLEIFDLASGTRVASLPNLTAGSRITLGHLSAGTYVIKVTSTDNKISYQFKMVKL